MKVVLQRVASASVTVGDRTVGSIDRGLMLLAAFIDEDTETDIQWMVEKIVGLRIFSDSDDKMNLSLGDVDGAVLVVSQFTLYGDVRKGRRPSFVKAARPEVAQIRYEEFVRGFKASGIPTETGEFGAMMQVELVNDGPVTLVLEK